MRSSRFIQRLGLLAILPLLAASTGHAGCGRLGYEERARTPAKDPDAGSQPAPDDDAGDP